MIQSLAELRDKAVYLLEFLDISSKPKKVLILAEDIDNGVIMSGIEDTDMMRATRINGKPITVLLDRILKIEKYKVTGNWGGNGHKTVEMTGEGLAEYTSNCGGEADRVSQVKDSNGNVVFDKNDRSSRSSSDRKNNDPEQLKLL
jgi:hypothetical protein